MLQLLNRTRFAVKAAPLVAPDGAHIWTVIIKATYALEASGRLRYHPQQEPIQLAQVFTGEFGRSTLLRDIELVYDHPGTDVVVNGHAHPPQGASECEVSLEVRGQFRKALRVIGDREWQPGPTESTVKLSPRQPFEQMLLLWENAYGGVDPDASAGFEERNPAGRGFAAHPKTLIDQKAPNIEPLGEEPDAALGVVTTPAGLSAVAPSWLPRRKLAGTYDEVWRRAKAPFWPDDYDPHYACMAPAGQHVTHPLSGGEEVILGNLVRGDGEYRFRVPRERITVDTEIRARRLRTIPSMDRLIIEPDHARLIIVWRTSIHCGADVRVVRSSVVSAKRALSRAPAAPDHQEHHG